ncbi:MAG: type II 3-dehydroquinate dehydratase, partial [Candidatus Thiodiazotropha sp. (ex Lucinoma borealis)]|nr:type II 3-dehydroquinate dehydratase [Candidatus Thiodiazotropha sp. (ex Lucinoma borealis)]
MATILVLNGPNLNLLGTREPKHYGQDTLEIIGQRLVTQGQELGYEIDFRQSNAEHELLS